MQRFLMACVLLLVSLPLQAGEAVNRLAALLAAANSLDASFEQTITAASGVVSQRATGHMAVTRPHLFRWEVKTPFVQLIVADGKEVWVYDPDLAQAVVRPFDRQLSDTPALLFSGDAARIGERYTVSLLEEKGKLLRFELTPHDGDALFESLRVTFIDGRLGEMALADSLGQRTAIVFRDVKLNGKVAASQFRFVPPAGTDVIREGL
ncbi:MAG: outer membrane lipoprotein chaperone LolA [Pseudomonadota bacterium]